MAPSTRSRILKIWSAKYGLTLKPDSLSWLETMVDHFNLTDLDDPDTLEAFVEAMEKMAQSYTNDTEDYAQIVTVAGLEEVYARLQAVEGDVDALNGAAMPASAAAAAAAAAGLRDGETLDPATYTRIIDSFDMPWLHFDGEKRAFVHHNNLSSANASGAAGASSREANRKKPSLAGAPDSKAMYLRDRYNILKQVILRNEHFSPPALPGHDRDSYMKLTGIKNLLGRQGGHFLIFGMLTRSEDGSFVLEDLDDKIELDISEASPASGMFTEGCFALLDGVFTKDSIFKVAEIGHPPSERREVSRTIYGHVDFLGTGALATTEEAKLRQSEELHPDSFLVFSDLHLDSAKDLTNFRNVLQAYETHPEQPPSLCILCGNFSSKPVSLTDGKGLKEYTANFSSFADLLLSYPRCARDIHFVFVPGPSDPYDVINSLLPRRPLPHSLVKDLKLKLPKVTFTSNPCRISYKSQEIVVYREDLMSRILRNTVRLKSDLASLANQELAVMMEEEMQMEGADGTAPTSWSDEEVAQARKKVLSQFLVGTICDQSHLAPFPLSVRPVAWEYDQALRLFPLPTALILADKYLPYDVTYEDCHVFNPSGFAGSDYSWSVYDPAKRRSEQSGFSAYR